MSESHKKNNSIQEYLEQFESFLEIYFLKKAPALPKGGKEFIVKFAPWLIVLGLIISIPSLVTLFGVSTMISANPYGSVVAASLGPSYYISIAFAVIIIVMEIIALPGLFARSKKGWNFIFYTSILSSISSLISLNLAGLIIGALISFYLLFQVKSYYK